MPGGNVRVRLSIVTGQALQAINKTDKAWGKLKKKIFSIKAAISLVYASYIGQAASQAISIGKELIGIAEQQEMAEKKLAQALRLKGSLTSAAMTDMKLFASSIQEVTTIGDEAVLSMLAMGASMAGMVGPELKEATKAAIGLSEAYGPELEAAMRLMARARVGDTTQLKKFGIVLSETLSPQQKFNELLAIGASKFSLAEAAAAGPIGQYKQMANAFSDTQESLGAGLAQGIADVAKELFNGAAGLNKLNETMSSLMTSGAREFILDFAAGVSVLVGAFKSLSGVMKVLMFPIYATYRAASGQNLVSGIGEDFKASGAAFRTAGKLSEQSAGIADSQEGFTVAEAQARNWARVKAQQTVRAVKEALDIHDKEVQRLITSRTRKQIYGG